MLLCYSLYDDVISGTKRPDNALNLQPGLRKQLTKFWLRPFFAADIDHHLEIVGQES